MLLKRLADAADALDDNAFHAQATQITTWINELQAQGFQETKTRVASTTNPEEVGDEDDDYGAGGAGGASVTSPRRRKHLAQFNDGGAALEQRRTQAQRDVNYDEEEGEGDEEGYEPFNSYSSVSGANPAEIALKAGRFATQLFSTFDPRLVERVVGKVMEVYAKAQPGNVRRGEPFRERSERISRNLSGGISTTLRSVIDQLKSMERGGQMGSMGYGFDPDEERATMAQAFGSSVRMQVEEALKNTSGGGYASRGPRRNAMSRPVPSEWTDSDPRRR